MGEEPRKTHSELIGEGRTVAPGRSTLTSHKPQLVAGNLPQGFCVAPRKHPLENRLLQRQANSPKGATLGLLQASDSPLWGQEEKGQQGRESISPAVPDSTPCSTGAAKGSQHWAAWHRSWEGHTNRANVRWVWNQEAIS